LFRGPRHARAAHSPRRFRARERGATERPGQAATERPPKRIGLPARRCTRLRTSTMKPSDIIIAAPVRTPIGRFGGALASLSAPELGAAAARESIRRAGIAPSEIDLVIMGHARQAGTGPNPARQVGRRAGVPDSTPAFTVNMACASSMQAIVLAAQAVLLGDASVVLAGGMESMSNTPYLLPRARWGYRLGHDEVVDGMYRDGFVCPLCGLVMGETAEVLAERHGISRAEQDAYAVESQRRCEAARREGRFREEIVPVEVKGRVGAVVVDADEHPRDGVTAESMAKLRPAFKPEGTVHAGNSSGITDGAAAVIVTSAAKAASLGLRPRARVRAWTSVGVDPGIMGIGPVPAVRRLLEKTGLTLGEIDLIELNEAFAAQVLACGRELPFDVAKTNVDGGAIALGHPIGASGARLVVTLTHAMERRRARRGIATLCVSGGMGIAMLLENPEDR